jgi:hypothetical protein
VSGGEGRSRPATRLLSQRRASFSLFARRNVGIDPRAAGVIGGGAPGGGGVAGVDDEEIPEEEDEGKDGR